MGSKHEDTAVNMIVDHILNAHFFECPMIPINDIYAASPDGAVVVLHESRTKEQVLQTKSLAKDDVACTQMSK